MDTQFILDLIEKGIIEGLFVLIFVLFLWKAVPYVIKKIEELNRVHKEEMDNLRTNFTNTLDKQTTVYETSLRLIVEGFQSQSDINIKWHEKHEKAIGDTIKILENLNRNISKK